MIVPHPPRAGQSSSSMPLSVTAVQSPRRPPMPRLGSTPGILGPRPSMRQSHLPIGAVPLRPPPAAAVLPPIAATLPHVKTDCSTRLPRVNLDAPAPVIASAALLAPRPSLHPSFTVPLLRVEAVPSTSTDAAVEQPLSEDAKLATAPSAATASQPIIDDSPLSASSYDKRTVILQTATRKVFATGQAKLARTKPSVIVPRRSPRVTVPTRGQFVVCNTTGSPISPDTPDSFVASSLQPTPLLSARPVVRDAHVPTRKTRPPSHRTKRASRRVSGVSAASSTMPTFIQSPESEESALGTARNLYPPARRQRDAHLYHKRSRSHPQQQPTLQSTVEQYRVSVYYSRGAMRRRVQPDERLLEVFRSDEEVEVFEDISTPSAPERAGKLQNLKPQFSLRNLKLFARRSGDS